jgi:hypothetical protein
MPLCLAETACRAAEYGGILILSSRYPHGQYAEARSGQASPPSSP